LRLDSTLLLGWDQLGGNGFAPSLRWQIRGATPGQSRQNL
jgi:hypothetical protein